MGEAEDSEVDGGMVAAGGGRKGKRAEYRCAACGYGIVVYEQPPAARCVARHAGEYVEWRPFSQLLDFLWLISPARLARACLGSRMGLRLRADTESPASSVAGEEEDRGVAPAWAVRSALPAEASLPARRAAHARG